LAAELLHLADTVGSVKELKIRRRKNYV